MADLCQPIYIETESSSERYFLLIIRDEKLYSQGDPKPYYYAHNWGVLNRYVPFKSAEEAIDHAMQYFPDRDNITDIYSMGMNEFVSDKDLSSFNQNG